MDAEDRELVRAELAARLAYENLQRLGAHCEAAREEHVRLARERDHAIVGVARWGYSHRALAEAARVTPQRVTQIMARARAANPRSVPAGLVRHGRSAAAKPATSRERPDE